MSARSLAATSHDVRSGGRWTWRQRAKNAAIRRLVGALLGIADRLPARLLFALCRGAGRCVHAALPSLARQARERATAVLPPEDGARVARECFANAGSSLATTLLLRRPSIRASSLVHVEPAARDALARAGGAVVVSAHLGPFELVAPAVAELGLSPAVVVRESYDPALNAQVDAHRVARGVSVIHRGHPGAPARIVRALRSGQLVGLLPDLPARVDSVAVEFLGRPSQMPSGPARIALAADVPLLLCCLAPRPGRPEFELEVRRIDSVGLSAAALTQRVADALSQVILRAPAWWLWMATGAEADLQKKRRTG